MSDDTFNAVAARVVFLLVVGLMFAGILLGSSGHSVLAFVCIAPFALLGAIAVVGRLS